jgi:large subunit ribosomal protein L17
LGFRRGDGADMALIELVDFNDIYNVKDTKADSKKKTRRGNRRSKAAENAAVAAATAPAKVVAAPVEAEEVVETEAPAVEATSTDEETAG